jgi:hypothetical protein
MCGCLCLCHAVCAALRCCGVICVKGTYQAVVRLGAAEAHLRAAVLPVLPPSSCLPSCVSHVQASSNARGKVDAILDRLAQEYGVDTRHIKVWVVRGRKPLGVVSRLRRQAACTSP